MSDDNILDFDAENVSVSPWCHYHDARLFSDRAPMSEADPETSEYEMDLSWSGCPKMTGWEHNWEFGSMEYEMDTGQLDAEYEKCQNSWYTKVSILVRQEVRTGWMI